MGKHLREHVNAQYFEAANKLRSKHARRKIVAYVESYDDIYFWRSILSQYENSSRFFEVTLPTRDNVLKRGKKGVLMSLVADRVGTDMIACVDADYDYLLQGNTYNSAQVLSSPFILHTYAYSIENLQCYAPSLHNTCVMVTLNDHAVFNFMAFLEQYSEAVYPLFLWSIWFHRQQQGNLFTISDFCRTIELGKLKTGNAFEMLKRLQQRVKRRVREFERDFAGNEQQLAVLRSELHSLGVTPRNTYLYIQGHHLFDKVVLPLVDRVCKQLVEERENEIVRTSVHGTQRHNELSSYNHSVANLVQMLKRGTGYLQAPQTRQIMADIERMLQTAAQPTPQQPQRQQQHD